MSPVRPSTSCLGIVPARLGSTRLPGKMRLAETGAPLVVHTARNALASGVFADLVVAVDDVEFGAELEGHGLEVVLTSPNHPSGTDRALEALERLEAAGRGPWDVVVNVQGDEPELDHGDLRALVARAAEEGVELATLWSPLAGPEDLADPDVVKVVADRAERALYFSRAPIPHARPAAPRAGSDAGRRHVGVYAFRPAALRAFCALPRGELERSESLEQLRWLEAGRAIHLARAHAPAHGIDNRADYDEFVARTRPLPPTARPTDPPSSR